MLKSGTPRLGWLRQLLSSAQLDEYFEQAASWVDEVGCVQKDLDNEDCVQELIDVLALKRFEMRRLQQTLDTCSFQPDNGERCGSVASTAPSITEEPATLLVEAEAKDFKCGQSVLVDFNAELYTATIQCQNPDGSFRVIYDDDGTYEDVNVERINDITLAETDAPASAESGNLSKRAKARARKQKRDAASVSAPSSAPRLAARPATDVSKVREEASQDVWSKSKEGCKTCAKRNVPSNRVGWIIGTNGSQIEQIKNEHNVTVDINGLTVSVYGKHEKVKNAMADIDSIVQQESWSRPKTAVTSDSSLTKKYARWVADVASARNKAQQRQSK